MRDRALQQSRRSLRRDEAARRHPVRRAGIAHRGSLAARAAGDLRGRRAGARHLLRRAGDGGAARRRRSRAGITASSAAPRSRWCAMPRCSRASGRRASKYPVWMSHGDRVTRLPRGLRGDRRLGERAVRRHRRREAQVLRGAVPPRGGAHAARRGAAAQFRAQDRRRDRRLDHARLQGRGDREDPRAGRQGPGDLRAVGRRRFSGRRGADPRGDRRAAHLRVRRSRPDAARRGRAGRARCSATATTSRWCTCRPRSCSSTRSTASATRR